jgi:serine/threonine protein kinase
MTPNARLDAKSIFGRALELDGDGRAGFLDEACAGVPAIRAEVEELLGLHVRAGAFMRRPLGVRDATSSYPSVSEGPGTRVGPYKLMEQIGEGGMGLVFVAEQEEPVRRKVALKIIKPGMDSKQVVARFEAERQALAMMDHTNIAKVFDAGATESGRPFFVMELVHGVPITEYCDANELTPRQRLALFVPVCQAIQHAHQKGIIHRDIKPSNILVTMYDDRPVPKVIDFGVAKAVEQRLTEKTIYTQFGALVGTFEYMSPEQAEMNAFGVDTRSDIYALGVLLFELLTGSTPLERPRLRQAGFNEIVRLIKEEEPPKPSVRLSTTATLAKVAEARKTEPGKLSRLLRGELDWVVMKCLEKDRSRRYDTASNLARDVERFMKDEPVEARPPSAWYRLRKAVRRNRVALAVTGVVGVALVLVTAVSLWQAVRVSAERDRALAAEEQAVAEKATAQATLRFLLADVLEQAGPEREENRNLKVRELLDRTAKRLEESTELPPLTESAIRQTVGRIYWGLGEYKLSETQLARAYDLQRQHAGDDAPDTLEAAFQLAWLYWIQNDFAKAEPLYLRVYEGRRRLYGDEHRETLKAVNGLAYCCNSRGESDRAEKLYVPALEASRRAHGDDDPVTLELMFNLGTVYSTVGRYEEAEPLMARALKGHQAILKDKHPRVLSERTRLSHVLLALKRFPEAELEARQSYEDRLAVHGETDPHTLTSQASLIQVYLAQGRRGDADPLMRDLRANARRRPERMPGFTMVLIARVGEALLRERDFVEAESFARLMLELAEKQPLDDWSRPATMSLLGACLLGQKRYAEAEPLLQSGYNGLLKLERDDSRRRQPYLTEALERLVHLYDEWHKPDEAARRREELEAARKAAKKN